MRDKVHSIIEDIVKKEISLLLEGKEEHESKSKEVKAYDILEQYFDAIEEIIADFDHLFPLHDHRFIDWIYKGSGYPDVTLEVYTIKGLSGVLRKAHEGLKEYQKSLGKILKNEDYAHILNAKIPAGDSFKFQLPRPPHNFEIHERLDHMNYSTYKQYFLSKQGANGPKEDQKVLATVLSDPIFKITSILSKLYGSLTSSGAITYSELRTKLANTFITISDEIYGIYSKVIGTIQDASTGDRDIVSELHTQNNDIRGEDIDKDIQAFFEAWKAHNIKLDEQLFL